MRTRVLIVALAFTLLLSGHALAEVRTAIVNDPRDATLHENVDGTSYREPYDIKSVQVSYDTAGSISITLAFYEPLPQADSISAPTYAVDISERDGFGSCEAQNKGDVRLEATVPPDAPDPS